MGSLQEGLQKVKEAYKNAKSTSEREEEMKAKPGIGIPASLSKQQKEAVQLKNERARNPNEFDKAKQMYDMADQMQTENKKKGGCVKMAAGGSASSRADGCAVRGKTKGRIV